MDSEHLPLHQPAAKTYKHFTIDATRLSSRLADEKFEFLYLGSNSAKIRFLVQTFESGYAAESVEKALSVLNRIRESSRIPDVIIIDSSVMDKPFSAFQTYLQSIDLFKAIPVILDISGLTHQEIRNFKAMRAFDDFYPVDRMESGSLLAKVHFLVRAKKQPVRERNSITGSGHADEPSCDYRYFLKRLFDIVVSLIAIITLSPIFLIIALAIKFESGGPVLYVSTRAGRGYKIFNFLKFRTMVLGADEKLEELWHLNHYSAGDENAPVFFKVFNDTRKTRVGAILRSTSMDELPQFFNVLAGHMSLVGNRPLPLYEAAKLTTDDWAERFMAPAGITGLWQIKKRRQGEMTMEQRIHLDIAYSRKYNFLYDLWIIANTPTALIQKSNT